jgi:hypothetical protein
MSGLLLTLDLTKLITPIAMNQQTYAQRTAAAAHNNCVFLHFLWYTHVWCCYLFHDAVVRAHLRRQATEQQGADSECARTPRDKLEATDTHKAARNRLDNRQGNRLQNSFPSSYSAYAYPTSKITSMA